MRLLPLALILVACGASGAPSAPPGVPAEVRSAPERVEIEGISYTLEAHLSRDFMPIAPPDGRPLAGIVSLVAAEPRDAPRGLRAETVWVVSGAEVWAAVPRPLQTLVADRRYHLQLQVGDGPKWKPDTLVDVVLRFSAGGTAHLVRAAAVRVSASL